MDCFTCCAVESRLAAAAMVNAASSAGRVTVRLTGALMPSNVCAAATQESAAQKGRIRSLMGSPLLREAVRDVGVEGVLRARACVVGSGRECASAAEERRRDITDIRVSRGVNRFAHTF